MRRWLQRVLLVLFLLQPLAAVASEVPCNRVLSEVNRRVTRRSDIDISDIAKKLDTKIAWVENCLKVYGRRYRRPGFDSDGGRDEALQETETGADDGSVDVEDPDDRLRR